MPTSIPIDLPSASIVSSPRTPTIFIAIPLLALLIALLVATHGKSTPEDVAVVQSVGL